MNIDWNWVLLIGGALLVLVEVALGGFAGFDLVLIGSSFLLGGALGLGFHSTPVGFLVASALCLAYIVGGRRWVRDRMRHQPQPSNMDALLGASGFVTVRIGAQEPGQVRVRDEVWRAVPMAGTGPFEAGTSVIVQGVEGVTLQVKESQ